MIQDSLWALEKILETDHMWCCGTSFFLSTFRRTFTDSFEVTILNKTFFWVRVQIKSLLAHSKAVVLPVFWGQSVWLHLIFIFEIFWYYYPQQKSSSIRWILYSGKHFWFTDNHRRWELWLYRYLKVKTEANKSLLIYSNNFIYVLAMKICYLIYLGKSVNYLSITLWIFTISL